LSEEQGGQIEFAAEVLAELREKKDHLPIARLLTLAIDRTGYDASLLTEFLGARKLANLRKLLDMARQFDESGLFTLADFVDRLREAVAATKDGKAKLSLLLQNGDYFETHELKYTAGERYPHLERDKAKPDLLSEIFKAKTK